MFRTFLFVGGGMVALAALIGVVGCSTSTPSSSADQVATAQNEHSTMTAVPAAAITATIESDEEHGHKPGAHGGIIVSLGRDSYHVEAIVTSTGELRLYMLGNDESRVIDIERQELVGYVKPTGGTDSTSIDIQPHPQPGDAEGKASLFVAALPDSLVGQSIDLTVPNITIAGERFRLGFTTKSDDHGADAMPAKVADDEERSLYLTPGGKYTEADIQANGNVTASIKFAGLKSSHDMFPKPGDKICPVTQTKANPQFTWIVGGKTYEFCCPPCVDEFVKMAKASPDEVKEPVDYVKR